MQTINERAMVASMIKLKGFITYNFGGGYCWIRVGNLFIEWKIQK